MRPILAENKNYIEFLHQYMELVEFRRTALITNRELYRLIVQKVPDFEWKELSANLSVDAVFNTAFTKIVEYIKIIHNRKEKTQHFLFKNVHSFVDPKTGEIFKARGKKNPRPDVYRVRGNIFLSGGTHALNPNGVITSWK